jgi:trimeric autotransporter adhesin
MLTYRQQQRLLSRQVDAVKDTRSAEDLDNDDELVCDAVSAAAPAAAPITATGDPLQNARAWYAAAAASLPADAPQQNSLDYDTTGTDHHMLTDSMSEADSNATTMQLGEPAAAAAAAAAVAQRNLKGGRGSSAAAAANSMSVNSVPPLVPSYADTAVKGITLQSAVDAAKAAKAVAAAMSTASSKRPAVIPSTAASTAGTAAASQLAEDRKRSRISIVPAAAASQKAGDRKHRISILPAAAMSAAATIATTASATASRHTTGSAGAAAAAAAASVASQQTADKHNIAAADSMSVSSVRDYMRGANAELMANESVSKAFARLLLECHRAVEDAYSVSHDKQCDSATAAAVTAVEATAAAMVAKSRDRSSVHKAAEQDYLRDASNKLLAADNITIAYKRSLNNCYWTIMQQL